MKKYAFLAQPRWIGLTILMVFINRQLTNSLPPERFRSVIRLLLPAYLLLNLYFNGAKGDTEATIRAAKQAEAH